MKKSLFLLLTSVLFLTGCIAGGGTPYNDEESNYLPELTFNQTIIDDEQFTLVLKTIERKTHPDVGNIATLYFDYKNKTSMDAYLTTDTVKFDQKEVDISIMAFFEEMPANSEGEITAIFQDIRDNDWYFDLPTQNVHLLLDIVDQKDSSTYAQYVLDVDF